MEYTEKLKLHFEKKYKPLIDGLIKEDCIPDDGYLIITGMICEDRYVYRLCELFYPEYDFSYGYEPWMIGIKKTPNGHPQHFRNIKPEEIPIKFRDMK